MDDRQQQVKIGAGLEESRINRELIDWLNKWGLRILIVVLFVVAAYQGNQFLTQRAHNARNTAFVDFYQIIDLNNPGAVLEFGDEHDGEGALWELAYINGGMMLLSEGTRGVSLEAQNVFSPTPEETLSREDREQRYTKSSEVFGKVIERFENDPAKRLVLLQALSGKASAEMSLGNAAVARGLLERVVEIGNADGFPDLALLAQERLSLWSEFQNAPMIVSRDQVRSAGSSLPFPGDFQRDGLGVIRADDPKPDPALGETNVEVITLPDDDNKDDGSGDEPDAGEPATDPDPATPGG